MTRAVNILFFLVHLAFKQLVLQVWQWRDDLRKEVSREKEKCRSVYLRSRPPCRKRKAEKTTWGNVLPPFPRFYRLLVGRGARRWKSNFSFEAIKCSWCKTSLYLPPYHLPSLLVKTDSDSDNPGLIIADQGDETAAASPVRNQDKEKSNSPDSIDDLPMEALIGKKQLLTNHLICCIFSFDFDTF